MKILGDSLGRPIAILSAALCVFGLIAVLSASSTTGASDPNCGYNSLYFFIRQAVSCLLGIGLLVVTRRYLDLDKMRKWMGWPAMFVCLFLSITMLFCPAQNFAHRWVTIGPLNIQVGEICKIVFICFWADILSRIIGLLGRSNNSEYRDLPVMKRVWKELKIFFLPALFSFIMLVVIEVGRDLGTCVLLGSIVLAMLLVAGFPFKLMLRLFGLLGIGGVLLIAMRGYRVGRILAWIDPDKYAQSSAYQVVNSFLAISSGGLWGRGLTMSGQKYGFLPEQHTDFIYAIICEELGFIGSLGLLALLALLCYCGFKLASRCKDPYRGLLAFGIAFQLGVQTLINVTMVTGLIPNKGLPLPFISYGGSSMCMTLFSMGILLNIADTFRSTGEIRRKKTRPMRRTVRRAHSLSNSRIPYPSDSSEVQTSPISSGEWRSIIETDAATRKQRLPEPRVKEGWSRVVAIDRNMRERRNRLKNQRKIL